MLREGDWSCPKRVAGVTRSIKVAAPDAGKRKERGFKSANVRRYPAHVGARQRWSRGKLLYGVQSLVDEHAGQHE